MSTMLFINDWRSYNNGEWISEKWMTPQEVLDFLDGHAKEDREWFVADFDSTEGLEIPECCNVYDICQALLEIEDFDDFEQKCVAAIVEDGISLEDAPHKLDEYVFFENVDAYHDSLDECLDLPEDSVLSRYFDYDAYHRDCDFDVTEASNGICFM